MLLFFLVCALLAACAPTPTQPTLQPPGFRIVAYTPTPTITLSPTPTLTPTVNPLRTIAPTLSPTPTPDPYISFYIETLRSTKYGGGVLEAAGDLNAVGNFSRKLFKYRSQGLDLYGFLNIPDGEGPFPVVIMLHGYVDPDAYATLDYSIRYTDALADAGFLVLHPNLRGYSPSENGENRLGIGDTVDTLNLINLVRQQAGSSGILEKADDDRIGLWGHSMGGGIVMRVLAVDPDIDAALLYASIHANEEFNLAHFDADGRGQEKLDAPSAALRQISPLIYLDGVKTPISVHHGEADATVPVAWSQFLCQFFGDINANFECVEYPGQPHTFRNSGDTEFIANMIRFFSNHLN